jgi:hypothetical protein
LPYAFAEKKGLYLPGIVIRVPYAWGKKMAAEFFEYCCRTLFGIPVGKAAYHS